MMARYLLAVGVVLTGCLSVVASAQADCATADRLVAGATGADREGKLRAALAACPNHPEALNNLGLLFEEKGALAEAESYYRAAAAADTASAAPWAGLGDVLRAQGRPAEAAGAYVRFFDLLDGEKMRGDPSGLSAYEDDYRSRLAAVRKAAGLQQKSASAVVTADTITRSLTQLPSGRKRGLTVMERPSIDIQILFETGKADILPASMTQLEQVARALMGRELADARIVVEGHTDNVGDPAFNQQLSIRRAESVRDVLADRLGVPAARLKVEGFGESRPIVSNAAAEGRAKNRRVTFVNEGG